MTSTPGGESARALARRAGPAAGRHLPAIAAALYLFVASVAAAQGWTALPDLAEARQEIAGAALGETLYVVGGFSVDRAALASAESYTLGDEAWQQLPDMPLAVHHPAAAVVDDLLVVIGGYPDRERNGATDAVQIYDPAVGEWRMGAPMPAALGGLAAVTLDGRAVVVGGENMGRSVTDVRAYDPASDTWSDLPSMPTPRDHLAVAVLDGRVHALGGRNEQSFILAVHEVFDPASSTWSTLEPMPTARSGHAAAALGGCLFALGGEGNPATPDGVFPQVERFDPGSGTWTALEPMPTPRHGMSAIAVDGRIVVVGGADVEAFGALSLVDAFTPAGCG